MSAPIAPIEPSIPNADARKRSKIKRLLQFAKRLLDEVPTVSDSTAAEIISEVHGILEQTPSASIRRRSISRMGTSAVWTAMQRLKVPTAMSAIMTTAKRLNPRKEAMQRRADVTRNDPELASLVKLTRAAHASKMRQEQKQHPVERKAIIQGFITEFCHKLGHGPEFVDKAIGFVPLCDHHTLSCRMPCGVAAGCVLAAATVPEYKTSIGRLAKHSGISTTTIGIIRGIILELQYRTSICPPKNDTPTFVDLKNPE